MPKQKSPRTLEEVKEDVKVLSLEDRLDLMIDLQSSITFDKGLYVSKLEKIKSAEEKLNGK